MTTYENDEHLWKAMAIKERHGNHKTIITIHENYKKFIKYIYIYITIHEHLKFHDNWWQPVKRLKFIIDSMQIIENHENYEIK